VALPTIAGVLMRSVATPLWSRTVSCSTLRARHRDGASRVLELSGEADLATIEMMRRELTVLTTPARPDAVVDVTRSLGQSLGDLRIRVWL
jgi:hypothetical protein